VQNLAGGSRYLASMLRQFGRLDLALAAYNAGPGRVARTGGIPSIAETQGYVTKILTRLDQPPAP
jgi:soluble lytic murein transglycosylase-like protein